MDVSFPTCIDIENTELDPCEITEVYRSGRLQDWTAYGYCGLALEDPGICNEYWQECAVLALDADPFDCMAEENLLDTAQVMVCGCYGYPPEGRLGLMADSQLGW